MVLMNRVKMACLIGGLFTITTDQARGTTTFLIWHFLQTESHVHLAQADLTIQTSVKKLAAPSTPTPEDAPPSRVAGDD